MREGLRASPKRLWLIGSLAKNDFVSRYANSQLGVFWAFFRPIVIACVYIFVFSFIARATPVGSRYPYSLWMLPGLIVWFVFQEALSSGVTTLSEYSFLVKNIRFDISILPYVKVASSFIVHTFFVVLVFVLYLLWGLPIKPQILQLPYYYLATYIFTLSVVRLACACQPFFKDLTVAIEILLIAGVWACPIMWNLEMAPQKYWPFFKINPIYHLVQGYRTCFMGDTWLWNHPVELAVFWLITGALFFGSRRVFNRLSVHFADVI